MPIQRLAGIFASGCALMFLSGYQVAFASTEELAGNSAQRQRAVQPEFQFSNDTDQFEIGKLRLSFLPSYSDGWNYWRISTQTSRFRQAGWQVQGRQIGLGLKRTSPNGVGFESNLYLNDIANHQSVSTDNRLGWRVGRSSLAEISLVRDVVESKAGLLSGRHYLAVAGSLETQWSRDWSSVGQLSKTHFSDGNDRLAVKAKLIYDLVPDYGITTQLWYQNYRDDDLVRSNGAYFNPSRYQETLAVLGIRRTLDQLVLKARLGAGTQRVQETGASRSQFADLVLESRSGQRMYFRTILGYKLSAGVSAEDYRYRYITQELVIPLGN